jgi:hypothetical protein
MLHPRAEGSGKPQVRLVTAGQRHEATQLGRLLDEGAVKRAARTGAWAGPASQMARAALSASQTRRRDLIGKSCLSSNRTC